MCLFRCAVGECDSDLSSCSTRGGRVGIATEALRECGKKQCKAVIGRCVKEEDDAVRGE